MKFAQYLEENCTPEWKRCYLDYRRLKKQIKVISLRQARERAGGGRPVLGDRGDLDSPLDEEDEVDEDDDDDDAGSGSSHATGITLPSRKASRSSKPAPGGADQVHTQLRAASSLDEKHDSVSHDFAWKRSRRDSSRGNSAGFDALPPAPSTSASGINAAASSSQIPMPSSRSQPKPSQRTRRRTHTNPVSPSRPKSHSTTEDEQASQTSSEDGDAGPHAPMRSSVSSSFRDRFGRFSRRSLLGGRGKGPDTSERLGVGAANDGLDSPEVVFGARAGKRSKTNTGSLPTIDQSPWLAPDNEPSVNPKSKTTNVPIRGRIRPAAGEGTETTLVASPKEYGSVGSSPRMRQSPRFVLPSSDGPVDRAQPSTGRRAASSASGRTSPGRGFRSERTRDISPPPSLSLPEGVEENDLPHTEERRQSVIESDRRPDGPMAHEGESGQTGSSGSGQDGVGSTSPMIPKSSTTMAPGSPNARKREGKSPRLLPLGKSPKLQAWIAGGGGTGTSPDRARRQFEDTRPSTEMHDGVRYPHTIEELYAIAYPDERKFFTILDGELEKVESFYQDRENDSIRRSIELKRQLAELAEHRRVFHEAERRGEPRALRALMPSMPGKLINEVGRNLWGGGDASKKPRPSAGNLVESVRPGESKRMKRPKGDDMEENEGGQKNRIEDAERGDLKHRPQIHKSSSTGTINQGNGNGHPGRFDDFDPDKYQRYKKSLRSAALEFYKELEILKNYRILNLTGFKKALKKFEKVAGLRSLDLYMDHRVAKQSFAQGTKVDKLLKETEDEFTIHFEKGDHKRAVGRLRGQFVTQTHHYSAFCAGVYIGIGLPGMILGLTSALSSRTQRELPQYDGLLQVYGTLFLPVLFAMLFELNLLAYVAARINYTFIMEIDSRTAIDHRQFLEVSSSFQVMAIVLELMPVPSPQIPALLFAVLAWCFMFSMWEVGTPSISPFAWPIVWIVFMVAFFFNPVPVYYQHARYWLISVLGRTLTPGYSRVEFIAFFVADELNSLVYSVSGLWFIGCAYNKGWPSETDIYDVCSTSKNWVYGLLLCLPALIRWIQCVKRYKDSGLSIHLINAGKYAAGMLQYATFIYWRSQGSLTNNVAFAVWVPCAAFYAVYASSWDLTVDWGLLRPRYGYLRESLGYPYKGLYYFAMVSNVLLRFIWLFYLPNSTTKVRLRSFIFALMEMLRRWQWNFFRVETEQMGNTDQYRITREIPLPYHRLRDDDDEEGLERKLSRKATKFGLQSVAIRLGELRERMTTRDRDEHPPGHAHSDVVAGSAHSSDREAAGGDSRPHV